MYRIAVVQTKPEFLQPEANRNRIRELLTGVRADLIVLPELATSGYFFADKSEVERVSEAFPQGQSFIFFSELSRQLDASLIYGFPEKDGDRYYNSSALVNPDGTYSLYRKTHLFFREKLFFSPGGTGFFVCAAKGGVRVGMMVCFDWQFPEAARSLALQGAQVICHPANLVLPWCQEAMKVRSLENRVFSVTANRIGTESRLEHDITFTGQSQILSTQGDILCRLSAEKEEIGFADIDPEQADDKMITPMNDAFGDRRPAFYTELVKARKSKNV